MGPPLFSNLKNCGVPQLANIDSGQRVPSFQEVNGLNTAQSNLRSEVARNQFHNQQMALNGFMQGKTAMRHYEANLLGMDASTYQNTVSSKGLSIPESHHRNGTDLQKKDFLRYPNVQPPVSFNSFGGQEQMVGQHPGLLHSLQRQQSGINDMQLLQEQMILRQLQDNQRQLFQHQGAWQQNSPMNLLSSTANQASANHSPSLLNEISAHDSSNKQWPELLESNPNRQHLGASVVMQRSSSGFELSSEQSQALCTMGLALQQCDQSLYGLPVPGARENLSQTQIQRENHVVQQMSSFGNSFSRNQHAASSDHDTMDGSLVSRQEFPGKQDLASLSNIAPEKISSAAAHSQNTATLDPTEERILFGSDDNLWEAFGGEMSTGLGGSNMTEGSGLFGELPSLQSGSWSALMQSALAETSSVETGQQEEWSGLSFRSAEPTTGHPQSATFNYGIQQGQPSVWGESNMLAASRFAGSLGHQLGCRAPHERTENMQTDSSSRYRQDSSEGIRHSEPSLLVKPSTESIQICGKADNASTMVVKQHSSGSWTHQRSMPTYDACSQLNDRADGWNTIGSRTPGEDTDLKNHFSETILQSSQSGRHDEWTHEIHEATAGKTDKSHSLAVGSDQLESHGGTMLQRQDSSTSNADVNSSSSKAFHESNRWLQNNQSSNLWRQVDSSANCKRIDGWGKVHHVDKGSNVESSGNRDVLEWQNSCNRENSSGFPSNASRHASSGLVLENTYIHSSNSHTLHGSKENYSVQAVQKPVGILKFQYHPMGDVNVDMDNSGASKSDVYPQASAKQVFNKFSPSDGSGGGLSMNKSAQPSQNMLELLHKLDRSKEHETASRFSSSDRKDAYEAETSDGSVGQLQQNQFPGSQGFGLQLAPPSQRLQNPDHAKTPSSYMSSDRSDMGHRPFIFAAPSRSLSSLKDTNDGENRNDAIGASEQIEDKSSMGFSSGFPFLKSFQNQHDAGRALPGLSVDPTLHRIASHSKAIENTSEGILLSRPALSSVPDFSASASKDSNAFAAGAQSGIHAYNRCLPPYSSVLEAGPMSHPSLSPNVPQQTVFSRGLCTNTLGSCTPGLLKPPVQSNDTDFQGVGAAVELSASVSFKPPESSRTIEGTQITLQGGVSLEDHVSDTPLPGSVPNSNLHQSYSLLHQIQATKSVEVDPSNRTLKRFKGPDNGVDFETVPLGGNQLSDGHSATVGGAHYTGSQVDGKVFKLLGKPGENCDASSASLDMGALRRTGSSHASDNSEATLRHEHSKMAPSRVGQPGTLINGQALQVSDAQRMAALQHMELAKLVQKPADSLLIHEPMNQSHTDSGASPANTGYSWLPTSTRTNISSQNSLPSEVTDQSLIEKQKKRKIPATVVQAWHKEAMSHARLQSARTTEIEWARATNRLVQKMVDDIETNEGLPSLRPKKRLVLTTQLMQQLLRPPPAPFLALDSSSQYENVTYCVNKSAVGDACRAVHFSKDDPSMSNCSEKILLEEMKVSERTDSEDIAKSVEDLVGQTKKLENELSRLEQRSSVGELRLELQDLEKYSIINRFAKFHVRNQSIGSGPSSSDPFSYPSRPMPEKCAVAIPMPRNLPENAQCLSL